MERWVWRDGCGEIEERNNIGHISVIQRIKSIDKKRWLHIRSGMEMEST